MADRRFPPIGCLIPFEAAARLGSMSAAARELGVSQPAISRQLQILETDLGQALFHRNRRGLSLTTAGNAYRHAVALGLDHIAAATATLRAQGAEHSIRIAANFGFAQQWLMPRFAKLRAAHPQLAFRLMTSDDDAALDMAECDIAIRFGIGDWPGWHVTPLFAEEVFPICTPSYLEAHAELKRVDLKPADLTKAHLLHLDSTNADWLDWGDWFRWHHVTTPAPKPQMLYSTYPLVLQAILSSEGVGLGWRGLVDGLLASGTLVQLLPGVKRDQHGYFITWRKNHAQEKLLRKIAEWMVGEAR
ncbi:LysR substrate-binding domain-containing protein [Dongia rigui]|uniref:LysR substrate-binding domain-containing protein n=1 Tax=Dongia rigui TaxID=940149 RepID=A0ABU5DYC3_9PROT|nr:LysR substrate-binding domain-containing protein [Dongia rigui]MDY0872327.1 LysR substrate-binding domain-containing protein [Dongia rigui]